MTEVDIVLATRRLVAAINRLRAWPKQKWEQWKELRRKVDISAKCPACGVVKAHVIKWNPITRLVVHTCIQCAAEFAQEPIIKASVWQKRVIEERE